MSAEPDALPVGPVQLLVVGFDRPGFNGEVLAEFERLRESNVVRLLDLLVVHKDSAGVVERAQQSIAPDDGAGVLVETLVGLGPADRPAPDAGATGGDPILADEYWSLDEAIPNDSDAVIVLVEHRWAIGARDAVRAAGGRAVADAWLHPTDLVAAGLGHPEVATPADS